MDAGRRIDVEAIARRIADAVGDGAVVRLHAPRDGMLRTAAIAHRLPAAVAGADCPDLGDRESWSAHVLRSGRPVRLARVRPTPQARRRLAGCHVEERVGAVVIVPLRLDGAVVGTVTAFREPGAVPYSLREQLLVESVLGRALRAMEAARTGAEGELGELAALRRSDAAVWATDLSGRTLFVTPAMSELLALPAADVVGLPMTDFVDVPPLSLTGMVPDEPERGDRRLLRADGSQLWLQTSSTPLVGADGRRCGAVTTAVDVTARKTTEVALRMRLDATRGLLRLVSEVLRGRDRGELLTVAVAAAAELLDAWRVAVFELDEEGMLRLRAGHGWPRGATARRELPALRSPAALALRSDEPLVVRDLSRWERLVRGESVGEEVQSGCWIGIGGQGVLAVLEREPRDFRAEEVDLLVSLAEALTACMPAPACRAPARPRRLAAAPGAAAPEPVA